MDYHKVDILTNWMIPNLPCSKVGRGNSKKSSFWGSDAPLSISVQSCVSAAVCLPSLCSELFSLRKLKRELALLAFVLGERKRELFQWKTRNFSANFYPKSSQNCFTDLLNQCCFWLQPAVTDVLWSGSDSTGTAGPVSSTGSTSVSWQCLSWCPVFLASEGNNLLAPIAEDLICAPASQAFVECSFSVCGILCSGRHSSMHKSLEMRACLKLNNKVLADSGFE